MSKIKMQNSSFYLLKNKIDFKIYYKLILLIKKIIVSNMSHFSEEIQSILKRLNKLERENRELKNENKQMKEKISKLENTVLPDLQRLCICLNNISANTRRKMIQERINLLNDFLF
jgi:predicted RNase H-like nuclease (RuvC/YqgF family)